MKSRLLLTLVLLVTGIAVAVAAPIGAYQQGTVVRMHMGDCQLMHRGFMKSVRSPAGGDDRGRLSGIHTGNR
jgi:hypothetical protein